MTNFSSLEKESFINLTTFKSSGQEKATPVWFTSKDQKLFIFTDLTSYKVKRIKHNPAVLLAASKSDGSETGPRLNGTARLLSVEESPALMDTFKKKYRLQYWFFNLMGKMRGAQNTYIEITPTE